MPISDRQHVGPEQVDERQRQASGSTPRIEIHKIGLRPIRSPIGPPMKVPTATAPRNTNRWICALCTDTAKRSIRKKL